VGDSGNYQKKIFKNAIVVLFTASFVVYSLNFLVPAPEPECL